MSEFQDTDYTKKAKNTPRTLEYLEALQAECDKQRQEWFKTLSPEDRATFEKVEELTKTSSLPIFVMPITEKGGVLYQNFNTLGETYDEKTKAYSDYMLRTISIAVSHYCFHFNGINSSGVTIYANGKPFVSMGDIGESGPSELN